MFTDVEMMNVIINILDSYNLTTDITHFSVKTNKSL